MTDNFVVTWEGERREFADSDSIDGLLRLIAAAAPERGMPIGVTFKLANGNTMRVALGGNHSLVSWMRGDLEPPYFHAAGTDDSDDDTMLFSIDCEPTELFVRDTVSAIDARRALEYFLSTGERLPDLKWEED